MSMKLTTTKKTVLLAIAFQFIWLSLISTAATDWFWIGPVLGVIAYAFILPGLIKSKMALPLVTIAAIGFAFDVFLQNLGIISLQANDLALTWLFVLWLVFVGVFYRLFSWLTNLNSVSSFILGSMGGLIAYFVASILGAITINDLTSFVITYGLFWGASFSIAAKIFVVRNLQTNHR